MAALASGGITTFGRRVARLSHQTGLGRPVQFAIPAIGRRLAEHGGLESFLDKLLPDLIGGASRPRRPGAGR